MFTTFIRHQFRDEEHASRFLVKIGGALGVVSIGLALIGLIVAT